MEATEVTVEDWAATYGSPYLVTADDGTAKVTLIEDEESLRVHDGDASAVPPPMAFVDGVRRGEATLYLAVGDLLARGIAGVHGRGAVLAEPGSPLRFDRCQVDRLVVWGSGQSVALPPVSGGWAWSAHSIASDDPDALLAALQTRMREAEGHLAEQLCGAGYLTVVDGPLNFVRSRDLPIIGLVKSHHGRVLPATFQASIRSLEAGQRTSLFLLRGDVYSSYVRLAPRMAHSGPWSGIVRIDIPASSELAEARRTADLAAGTLRRYAGVPYIDPRAPQNLQPIGALERHLRHLLGDPGLATRAVRSAVDALSTTYREAA